MIWLTINGMIVYSPNVYGDELQFKVTELNRLLGFVASRSFNPGAEEYRLVLSMPLPSFWVIM